jgi:hypothetical protein
VPSPPLPPRAPRSRAQAAHVLKKISISQDFSLGRHEHHGVHEPHPKKKVHNQVVSPEAGITDPSAAFDNLWHRLNAALADAKTDTSSPATPQAVPATPTDVAPDARIVSPDPPAQVPATGPTRPSAQEAPRLSPVPLSGPLADRSSTIRNPLRAGAESTSAAAARSLEASATSCNACRRRGDFIMPPVPGRPERSRAESVRGQ